MVIDDRYIEYRSYDPMGRRVKNEGLIRRRRFHQKYASQGLAVVGVSLDEDGWKVVKPFVESAKVPYRIVLGNDATAALYGIRSMPDTFLIDRQGRLAATYNGMVDRDNIEKNIQALLAEQ